MSYFIDTHTHIFSTEFEDDRESVIKASLDLDIRKLILPNIDSTTIEPMLRITEKYSGVCFPTIGLHPTSVNNNFEKELINIENWLNRKIFFAIGEIGIDLYWDNTFIKEQILVFKKQLKLAEKYNLPVIIHSRNSIDLIIKILEENTNQNIRGVFHCFSGTLEQAHKVIEMGYVLGIGGVVTYKNAGLAEIVDKINLEYLVLETDSPYLSPVPKRNLRNDSSNIIIIANKISEITNIQIDEIAEITTKTATRIFNI